MTFIVIDDPKLVIFKVFMLEITDTGVRLGRSNLSIRLYKKQLSTVIIFSVIYDSLLAGSIRPIFL